jgi:head-tail adaptor
MKLVKGPVNNSLQDTRSMMLYVGGSYDTVNYRLSYRKSESGTLAYQSFEGNGKAIFEPFQSYLSLSASERYNKYDASSSSVGYGENNAQLTVTYIKNIQSNMRLNVQANVLDIRSDLRGSSDSLSLQATYQIELNRVLINLSLQTAWSIIKDARSRDDAAHIDITRYF